MIVLLQSTLERQYGRVVALIDGATTADTLRQARYLLETVAECWRESGWGYQIGGLYGMIRERAKYLAERERSRRTDELDSLELLATLRQIAADKPGA